MERVRIQAVLADTSQQLALRLKQLTDALDLAADAIHLCKVAPDEIRRQLNQTFYERIYIDDVIKATVSDDILRPPFDEIVGLRPPEGPETRREANSQA